MKRGGHLAIYVSCDEPPLMYFCQNNGAEFDQASDINYQFPGEAEVKGHVK